MTDTNKCPVCGAGKVALLADEPRGYAPGQGYDCIRCGKYFVRDKEKSYIFELTNNPIIWAWLRRQKEDNRKMQLLKAECIDEIVKTTKVPSVSDKMYIFMKEYEKRTEHPGQVVNLEEKRDFPLIWARNAKEFRYLFNTLIEREFIKMHGDGVEAIGSAIITAKGWDYLDDMSSHPPVTNKVFVAMSFGEGTKTIWKNGIALGIRNSGYEPVRIDYVEHTEIIDDRIVKEIRESKFIVADATTKNHNVFWEAGFALGIGKTVIWTVQEDEIEDLPFDTSHTNHIAWKTENDLSEKLEYRICAVIGRGPLSE